MPQVVAVTLTWRKQSAGPESPIEPWLRGAPLGGTSLVAEAPWRRASTTEGTAASDTRRKQTRLAHKVAATRNQRPDREPLGYHLVSQGTPVPDCQERCVSTEPTAKFFVNSGLVSNR